MSTIFTGISKEPAYNKPLYGIHAHFTLSPSVTIPYFLTAIEVERAIDELKIHDEVSPALDRKWSLTELFQRELDESRVKDELVKGYLNDPTKLKFFNALTIVLMPKTSEDTLLSHFPPAEHDPGIPWNGTDQNDAVWDNVEHCRRINFGGVQYVIAGTQGRLRWNPELVHAVAVDGQHRLLALRVFREESRARALDSREKETHVPVIFLLLDERAGFRHSGKSDITMRSVSRELFTDLNKNAKQVDIARQIILDDLSVEARCLRTLVGNETASDSQVALPLSLVRWQDAVNRFDQNYYINSLVHLDLIVKSVLNISHPKDPMDREKVEKFISSLNDALGGADVTGERKLRFGGRTLNEVFREEYCDTDGEVQIPLTRLPPNFLDVAVKGFEANHKPWLLRLIRDFKPYADILRYARDRNLIEGVFGCFWAQTRRHQGLIKEAKRAEDTEWYKNQIQVHIDVIERMKGKDADAQWAFKAIFQKAMVRLGRVIAFDYGDSDPNLGTIDDLLEFLTALYDRGVLKVAAPLQNSSFDIWTFIATNPGGSKIKVAKGTEDRILSILTLWYFGNRKIVIDRGMDPSKEFTARDLLSFFDLKGSQVAWPDCKSHFEVLYKGFNVQGLLGKAAELSEKTRRKRVLEHFNNVMAVGILYPLTPEVRIDDVDTE